MNMCVVSGVQVFATPLTVCSPPALLSLGFSQQDYWMQLPFPPPGDLPDPGIKPEFPAGSFIGRWILYH